MALFWTQLHPKRFFETLNSIDQEAFKERQAYSGFDTRPTIALITAAFCLLLIHYLKLASSYSTFLVWIALVTEQELRELTKLLHQTGFANLISYAWWGLWHVVGYFVIPSIVIKYVMKANIADFGLRWGSIRPYIKWYGLLVSPIIVFTVLASFRAEFVEYYPFYRLAHRSWFDLLAWEVIYLSQFVCLEFFFRGFLLHACKASFGSASIFVMVLPYLMIHFPKPWLEATGAIFFGVFLGVLALRSRSIWGGGS